ncbi:OmpH family outer membrane protein [Paraburkholderia sp. DHOC27]|uniref:OmpH family outer membrane protein n=1 Tax=Paraburkholderia sp. DHOC27 TaxID=2303330 RepID=UPI000E3CAAA0|nr:OmpH family outer membrane protein [Paraburkholderia sp. DHOC27]RFU44474.1 hypothetical protein D0B32_28120 [Paraburkholderia sp. DHOC27]
MPDLTHVSLNVDDSGIKDALNQWFEAITVLAGIQNPHKLALLGMISTFELIPDTELYDQFIFRSWVDRSIINSPTDPGSPSFMSRYSTTYQEMLLQATLAIDSELSAEVRAQIETKMQDITVQQQKLEAELDRVRTAWNKVAAAEGLTDPTSVDYAVAQTGFYSTELEYSKITQYRTAIGGYLEDIDKLRAKQLSADDRNLIAIHQYCEFDEYKMIRPKTPDIERKIPQLNAATIDNPLVYGTVAFEMGQDILPSISLPAFLSRGTYHGIELSASRTASLTHESEWRGSLGGSFDFFQLNVHEGAATKVTEVIKRVGKLEIGFQNIEEIFAIRGQWFSIGAFSHPAVLSALKKNPKGLKAPLTYLVLSAIVVRGIAITVHFENSDDWDTFTQHSGSGGGSIFGIPIGLGVGHGDSATEQGRNRQDSTITFGDTPLQCRVVGFRVQQVIDDGGASPLELLEPYRSAAVEAYVEELKKNPSKLISFTLK